MYVVTPEDTSRPSGAFAVRVRAREWWERVNRAGAYAVAAAFVNGDFEIDGDLLAAIRWWQDGRVDRPADRIMRLLGPLWIESWLQSPTRARRNIRFHYDRSNRFYQQFLDRRMVYSCAYFSDPAASLEDAQVNKLDHICRKLNLGRDETFLDVGCGWGALVMHAVERYGVTAVGCTLSATQVEFGRDAVRRRGLADRIVIEDMDYRGVPGSFDKIASVGMYEHVGRRRLTAYFRTLAARLEPGGLFLNHGIARPQAVADDSSTRFIRRRVFPGGELPHLSDVVRAAEDAGFEVVDVENLRLHYALTCAHWVARLQEHRDACLAEVDAATYRTWLLYLAVAAVNFERGETDVYQTLLARRGPRARSRLARAGV
ncbi:MAG TPA: cyclopropane-fatty-acyl-phospholipid synthase family protein [Vicinamibacterales bacterium]|nr:cyclopropane-fatty-acyl-phospholipid synthase family protein [Vicinamibacterales bacterium]